jgi:hypothetical protein
MDHPKEYEWDLQDVHRDEFDDVKTYEITLQIWTGGRFVKFTSVQESCRANHAKRLAKDFHSEAMVLDCEEITVN